MPDIKNVIDLDLSVTEKKPIRFGNDDNRIVYLNLSDMNVLSRLNETLPKLTDLGETASKITDGIDVENTDDINATISGIDAMSARLADVDAKMREYIDYIFNAPVSSAAAPDGSMYDPFNGSFRFEIIITALINLYDENLSAEFSKIEKQVRTHTDKYTKGK